MNLQVSYNWIKEFLKTDKSAEDFAKEFSLKSQSVEHVYNFQPKFKGIITAKVLEVNKHPNADKLRLAVVDTGKEKLDVVCGAPNLATGQIVAFAPVGAKVLDPSVEVETFFTIKKAEIRGSSSNGMICSQKELGLGQDHKGIMVLPSDTKIGVALEKVLPLDDFIFDIEVTTNRPDAMSVIGLAQEGQAAVGGKFIWRQPQVDLKVANKKELKIEVQEKKVCSRYQAVVLSDVKVGPSPLWLQMRLMQAGVRPINNLVDITNYVALEYGQPTHVFDYDKIIGNKIIVRQAKTGENILALDGNSYKLSSDNLVIADSAKPLAVAGVMGGQGSATIESTTTVVFEAACFDAMSVRKTSRALNLYSDSSARFEKGLHPKATSFAIIRCIELAQELADGKVASEIYDVTGAKTNPTIIDFEPAIVSKHLGVEVSADQIKKILQSLAFEVTGSGPFKVTVPWWRQYDVAVEHDLIEEVARIYGYHNIAPVLPDGQLPGASKNLEITTEFKAKHLLAGLGFSEAYNYSMVSEKLLSLSGSGKNQAIKIDNPLNEDMVYMRTSLVPQLLQNISENINNFSEIKIFELSHIYEVSGATKLPVEISALAGAMVGQDNLFLRGKGVVEFLLGKLGINEVDYEQYSKSLFFGSTACLQIKKGSKVLGDFGIIKQDLAEQFGIDSEVVVFNLDFSILSLLAADNKKYQAISEFPSIIRDLSVLVDSKISWQQISELVASEDKLIEQIEYLNTFSDSSLGEGKKSIAFRMTIRSAEKTLKSTEADSVVDKVISKLKNKFKVEVR